MTDSSSGSKNQWTPGWDTSREFSLSLFSVASFTFSPSHLVCLREAKMKLFSL